MSELLTLTPEQKAFFDDSGFVHLAGFYAGAELERLRAEYHRLVTETEDRPQNMSYSFMEAPEGYPPDDFNPQNVVGMMDQVLGGDFWFDQFTAPRVVGALVDCLGPDLDFHNGKVRNKPPGFEATQGWHQDWPYERHSVPELAAAITYLDPTDALAGATEVIPGSHKVGELPTAGYVGAGAGRRGRDEARRVQGRGGRRGHHSRAGRAPGGAQPHRAQPQRDHQRIQDGGGRGPVTQRYGS